MKRYLLVFAAALTALLVLGLTFGQANGQCYTDPWGNRVCPQRAQPVQKAAKVVQSVPMKAGEVSVVVSRTVKHKCKCRCRRLFRWRCR